MYPLMAMNEVKGLSRSKFMSQPFVGLLPGGIPAKEPVLMQIRVSMQAMPAYVALPTLSEYMVEQGWTRCFPRIEEVGWPAYLGLIVTYLVIVEFGIYWIHRELHDIKPLYKLLHAPHHIYNKQDTLSPFAGLFSINVSLFPCLSL